MIEYENKIARFQYEMKRLGTEKFKTPLDVAIAWVKRNIRTGYYGSPERILSAEGGGDSCYWYGVTYGSCGGPGRGKIEATLRGKGKQIFKMIDIIRMVEKGSKQGILFK